MFNHLTLTFRSFQLPNNTPPPPRLLFFGQVNLPFLLPPPIANNPWTRRSPRNFVYISVRSRKTTVRTTRGWFEQRHLARHLATRARPPFRPLTLRARILRPQTKSFPSPVEKTCRAFTRINSNGAFRMLNPGINWLRRNIPDFILRYSDAEISHKSGECSRVCADSRGMWSTHFERLF